MRLTLDAAARILGCPLPCPGPDAACGRETALFRRIQGACIDSRLLEPGMLFFCLAGTRTDGHDHAAAAARAGAAAIVAQRPVDLGPAPAGGVLPPVLYVPDVVAALQALALARRRHTRARVVGLTGSAGKTSVKEALAAVLQLAGPTARNPLNLNNHIGLPLSMLNAAPDAAYWVMEAGISRPGDMEELGAVLQPDLALLLNAGEAHTEGLGAAGAAYHKSLLLDYVRPGGVGLVNADFPDLAREAALRLDSRQRDDIVLWGFAGERPDGSGTKRPSALPLLCTATYLGPGRQGKGRFSVMCRPAGSQPAADPEPFALEAPFRGPYGAENVAAVAAVVFGLGLGRELLVEGLARAQLPPQRFAALQEGGFTVIDDSYNANPLSAARMLEAAAAMAREQAVPLVLVMGEMGELGALAGSAHHRLGASMALTDPACIFWKGGHAGRVRCGLTEAGYAGPFYPVAGGQEFAGLLEEIRFAPSVVLFKGSRSNRLERLVEIFLDHIRQPEEEHAV